MKIALINNLYFPYNRGGAEVIVAKQVNKLKKSGHQVFLITTKAKNHLEKNTDEKIYYINSNYYNLNKIPKFLRLFWHLNQFLKYKTNKKIREILKKEKPDIVITHNLLGLSWQIPLILKRLNIKHYHFLHDIQLLHPSGLMIYKQENIINSLIASFYQSILRKFFNNCYKIISPSKWLLNLHLQKNFFSLSKKETKLNFDLGDVNISWPNDLNNFIFVGQLEKHKGIYFLLNFFKNNSNLKLTVVGDGSLKKELLSYEKKYKNINYLGKLKKEAVAQQLKTHDTLILPSLCYENSPTVIFEAISQNTPVIASKLGGIIELKELFNLRLFEPNNFDSLKKEIAQN